MADEKIIQLPSQKTLENLLKKARSVTSFISGKRGELAEVMNKAVEEQKLHKKAWKVALTVEKMDEDDRRLFWTHLDDYRKKLNLDDYAQTDLEDAIDASKKAEDDETDPPAEPAKPWPDEVATGTAADKPPLN